jgi:prepilin-type N-terminal cleavage/methylation domain-containing protein
MASLKFKKIGKNRKGFSLLEMIIAIALFAVIMLAATQIFQLVIESQRNSIASQDIQENMRYALEMIGKEIRMASSSNGICPTNEPNIKSNRIFNRNSGAKIGNKSLDGTLYFKNKDGECVSYYLGPCPVDNGLIIRRGDGRACLTPDNIKINNLEFQVIEDDIANPLSVQPTVTIMLNLETTGKATHKQKTNLQTTISARYYE